MLVGGIPSTGRPGDGPSAGVSTELPGASPPAGMSRRASGSAGMAAGGLAAGRHVCGEKPTGRPPAVESWTSTLADVEAWLSRAGVGDRLIYAHGPYLVRGAGAEYLFALGQQNVVFLYQKRAPDGLTDYCAMRNRVRTVSRRSGGAVDRENGRQAAAISPLMNGLLMQLKAAARQGQRCPPNSELAEALGTTIEDAKWQMRKLASAGLIRTRLMPAPGEPKFRIVEIVATGVETAGPGECK